MTAAQKAVLVGIVQDDAVTVRTIEYPSATDYSSLPERGRHSFNCLKVVYAITIQGSERTFVDWYEAEDGVIVKTREINLEGGSV